MSGMFDPTNAYLYRAAKSGPRVEIVPQATSHRASGDWCGQLKSVVVVAVVAANFRVVDSYPADTVLGTVEVQLGWAIWKIA